LLDADVNVILITSVLFLEEWWGEHTPPEPEVESSPVSAKGSNFCRFWIAELAVHIHQISRDSEREGKRALHDMGWDMKTTRTRKTGWLTHTTVKCSLGLFYLEYGVLWFWFGVGDGGGVDELVVDEVVREDTSGHSPGVMVVRWVDR
jgi:hypothetical protein